MITFFGLFELARKLRAKYIPPEDKYDDEEDIIMEEEEYNGKEETETEEMVELLPMEDYDRPQQDEKWEWIDEEEEPLEDIFPYFTLIPNESNNIVIGSI